MELAKVKAEGAKVETKVKVKVVTRTVTRTRVKEVKKEAKIEVKVAKEITVKVRAKVAKEVKKRVKVKKAKVEAKVEVAKVKVKAAKGKVKAKIEVKVEKAKIKEAKVKFENEIEFIDIREEDERDDGFIPGSSWIPISELNGRMDELPEEGEAIVYCKNGERSAYVLNILFNIGYKKLIQLEGGIDGWKKEGLLIES